MLSILSYNVNGVRAALTKGLIDFINEHQFDIICLQETKASQEQVEVELFEQLGYKHFWHSAQKKGYSGVATLCKQNPSKVVVGCGIDRYDSEGRILRTDFGDWGLLNCYFPSGSSGDERQAVKMDFLRDFQHWVVQLRQEQPNLIVVGDYNIAHQNIDIHDPVGNKNSSGFLPEERAWMTQWLANGFTDAYRHLNPAQVQYSWWSYRANARANNKGWRIDYQTVTDFFVPKLVQASHFKDAMQSDHCALWVQYDL